MSKIREPIIIPYNPKNKLIRDVDLKEIFSDFNIKVDIKNIELYRKALTHKSYQKKEFYNKNWEELQKAKDKMPNVLELREESNERLEFLGDTIIKAIIAKYLFERYPNEDEGFMTRLKTKIENRESLARFAIKIRLDEFVLISSQNENSNIGRTNQKILEDAFESFLGAVYLDQGFEVCRDLITAILEHMVDYGEILYNDTNYKDQLQRYYHTLKWEHPKFKLLSEKNLPDNKRLFTIGLLDNNGHIIYTASEHSKKKAQQKVSKIALYNFNQLEEDQMNDEDFEV